MNKEVIISLLLHNWAYFLWYLWTGPWQVMLKQADGSYVCVAESSTRFTLGEVSALGFPFYLLSVKCNALGYDMIWYDGRLRKNCCGCWDFRRKKEAHWVSSEEASRLLLSSNPFASIMTKLVSCTCFVWLHTWVLQSATWWEEDVDTELSTAWRSWICIYDECKQQPEMHKNLGYYWYG